jgi:hypothetical protein
VAHPVRSLWLQVAGAMVCGTLAMCAAVPGSANASSWALQAAPSVPTAKLFAISCDARRTCIVVKRHRKMSVDRHRKMSVVDGVCGAVS